MAIFILWWSTETRLTRAKLFTGYGSLRTCNVLSEFQKNTGGFEMAIGEDRLGQSIVANQPTLIFNYEQDYLTCTKKDLDNNGSVLHIEPAQMYDFEEILYKQRIDDLGRLRLQPL